MTDAALRWTDEFGADIVIDGFDLLADNTLDNDVKISLFTDRRARPDEEFDGDDPRGWWADTVPDVPGDETGCGWWLLARAKQTPETAERARQYGRDALRHLLEDGVAPAIDVTAEWIARGVLAVEIAIHRPNQPPARYRFKGIWEAIANAV